MQRFRRLARTLKRPKVATRHVLNDHILGVGDVLSGILVEFTRLGLALVTLEDHHGTLPALEQTIPTVEPLGAKRRRIKIARHCAHGTWVGELLDHAFHFRIRNGSFGDPSVDPEHEAFRIFHETGPGRLHEQVPLRRQDRVEAIEVLLAAAVAQHALRMFRHDVVGLDGPAVMCNHVELGKADLRQHPVQLVRGAFVAVVSGKLFGLSISLKVGRDTSVG